MNAAKFKFRSTNDIKALSDTLSQDRALKALLFGIGIKSGGYNLYAMGPSGIGKRALIKNVLTKSAAKLPTPFDWCYVNNFTSPNKPIALKLPHGRGILFQKDMQAFIETTGKAILAIFESEEYRSKLNRLNRFYDKQREQRINKAAQLYKSQHIKEKELKNKAIKSILKSGIQKLKRKYAKFKHVLKYLSAVHHDIIHHVDDFITHDEKTNLMTFSEENPVLIKYKVNLLVNNKKKKSAPVVFEEDPTYSNLVARVEHFSIQGNLSTNFTLIKAGSLHLANGGYLVIQARKIKKNTEAWEALKSILYAGKIMINPVENEEESFKPVSLEPMPVPLNVKVILIGSRNIYYDLCEKDSDFTELFKVAVDFDEEIRRNHNTIKQYAGLVASIVSQNNLLPFHATAVAEIIDFSSRLAEDVEKLSARISAIRNLILEADYWSRIKNKKMVRVGEVKQAIEANVYRMARARDIYYEEILRNFTIIHTTGASVGQINCLSVRRVGDFSYGHPTRVTARVRMGKGKLIDIQREIKMAGPMHSKAGLTIANFLASRFICDKPFALSASIAFEQIYCWTDGDSASVGELCALLSAISGIPIYQNFAITGSIDQYGEVQVVGGVNEKIEGFYDVCKEKGFGEHQGVLIPAANIKTLMLRDDVVKAAKSGKFSIYPIKTIDDAISHLTGWKVGSRDKNGLFPKDTLYYLIETRLLELANNQKIKKL
jgi:lon-related putative ATP-dependent protease